MAHNTSLRLRPLCAGLLRVSNVLEFSAALNAPPAAWPVWTPRYSTATTPEPPVTPPKRAAPRLSDIRPANPVMLRFTQLVDSGALSPDPRQEEIVLHLAALHDALAHYCHAHAEYAEALQQYEEKKAQRLQELQSSASAAGTSGRGNEATGPGSDRSGGSAPWGFLKGLFFGREAAAASPSAAGPQTAAIAQRKRAADMRRWEAQVRYGKQLVRCS